MFGEADPYLARTTRMSPREWGAYSDYLDTQAGLLGLPDGDSLSSEQLGTAMTMWQAPKVFGAAVGLTYGLALGLFGGVLIGLGIGALLARRRAAKLAAQQAQQTAGW
jgi:hypothetical protein